MKKRTWMIAAGAAFGIALALAARAQYSEPGSQLSIDRLAYVQPGAYLAGSNVGFDLAQSGSNYLLRFQGAPEVFVLYADHGPLGGRILKYDSGETALNVAGWGGMTLYTDSAPQGLPAMRTGDCLPPTPPAISTQDVQSAANDEAERLAYVRRLNVQFTADWNAIGENAVMRAFAFDAMENAARGIERYTSGGTQRENFAKRVSAVAIAPGSRPTLGLNGRTLVVTFNGGQGFQGRASSRAIARALGQVLR
ncbi:MAG TPA: DUF4908 domain-containing protein [Rhizomicrobium sp.]|nr:DUF4908 domain-containing protein [Rhizomicrobium sp.]